MRKRHTNQYEIFYLSRFPNNRPNSDLQQIEGSVRQRGNEDWIDFLNWLATKTRHGPGSKVPQRFDTLIASITSTVNGGSITQQREKSDEITRRAHLFCQDRQVWKHNRSILKRLAQANAGASHIISSQYRMYDDEEGRRNSRRTLFTLPRLEENEISYYMGRARDDDVRKCGIPRRLHVVEGA